MRLGGQRVDVEGLGSGFSVPNTDWLNSLRTRAQLGVDLGDGLHVHTGIDAELLAEDVHQLDGRGARAFGEIPAVVSTTSTPAMIAASTDKGRGRAYSGYGNRPECRCSS